MKLSERYCVI